MRTPLRAIISILLTAVLLIGFLPPAAVSAARIPERCVDLDLVPVEINTDHTAPTAFGIDVSHHQGVIDWDTVQSQIDFAIIRCGYGDDMESQDDTYWEANADACTRLGIPFGVYIYSYALTDAQALSEAQHVLRLIEGYDPALPIYLDLEDSSILNNCSTADILRHARIFCEAIEAAGYEVGVYANYNWWTNYLTSTEYDQWDRWIARYAGATGYSKDYTIWQYSSTGSISGISGNVDLDYWYGEFPPNSHTHSYTSRVTTAATCTENGVRTYSCDCGDSYTEAIPATGHSYRSAVTSPTCTEGGYTTHTCAACGHSYTDTETSPLGHRYEGGRCTVCGAADSSITRGDLNGDGAVSSADAVLLARHLAGLSELTAAQQSAADLNSDGYITSADAVTLARYLAGLIGSL